MALKNGLSNDKKRIGRERKLNWKGQKRKKGERGAGENFGQERRAF